jgi:hypothetical protein
MASSKQFKCKERVADRSNRRRGWPVEYFRCSRNAQDGSLYCKQHTEMDPRRIQIRDIVLTHRAERAALKEAQE